MQTNQLTKDNSGFVFKQHDQVYRYIHPGYEPHYQQLMNSGLYDELVKTKNLFRTRKLPIPLHSFTEGKVLQPEQIRYVAIPMSGVLICGKMRPC